MVGWIALYRAIVEHWVWNTSSKRFQRWVDLLFLAAWQRRRVGFGNMMVNLERGQIVTSIRLLMKRWGTNNTTVTTTLKLFVDNGMISMKRDKNMTIITIVNYNKYQRAAMIADTFSNIDLDDSDMPPEVREYLKRKIEGQNTGYSEHFRVQKKIPIKEDNNIKNKQQEIVDDDTRAKKFFEEFTTQMKIEKGCMTLKISQNEYIELVEEIINEWQFAEETDWSFRHLLNHMRRKVQELRKKPQEQNGRASRNNSADTDGDESESPFSRATIHQSQPDG